MPSPVWLFALLIITLESGVGIMLNACIVIYSIKNVKKGFTMNRCDQVHLMMGMVNILIQCLLTTQGILWVGVFHTFVKEIYLPLFFLNLFLIFCSYWLTSWLCVVYCISIANYTHRLFAWLKKRVSAFLPHLLLLTITGSLVICTPIFWATTLDPEQEAAGNFSLWPVNSSGTFQINLMYIIPANIFGCCLPFGLTLISIIFTINSLLRHIQNMKQNNMDIGQAKLQAHARAVKTMVLHLILVLSFFIAESLSFTSETVTVDAKTITVFICMLSYPTAQSAVIFQSNAKLRGVFVEMFCLKSLCNRPTQDQIPERVNAELQASRKIQMECI